MGDIIANLVILSISIFALEHFLAGIRLKKAMTAVVVAVVYSLVNLTLGWLLTLLAFPFIFITLGLFKLFINAFLLWLTDKMLEDFEIDSLKTTFIAALIITVVSTVTGWIF